MAEKKQKRDIFVEKRSRALAMMLLTYRDDLLIEEVKDDIGLDYIVRFHSKGKDGLREFGIKLSGSWGAATKDQADQVLRSFVQEIKHYAPFRLPVCLFFFTMERDGAWYTWVAEPESKDGKPLLRFCDEPDCRPLDYVELTDIIERVDLWYDVFFPSLSVNGPAGSKATRKGAR